MRESLQADSLHDGEVIVKPNICTGLVDKPKPIVSCTVFNNSDRWIGIGGPDLATDGHLKPGDSFTTRVRDLAKVCVFQRGTTDLRVRFVYEE